MKKISLIQFNHISQYAVYMFSDFLDKDYFDVLKNKVIELTNEDKMNRSTNVKANMTSYTELLEQEVFKKFFQFSATHLNYCLKLRSPHIDNIIKYNFTDAWGMQHKKGDFTRIHHHDSNWSGAFYFRIPEQTEFYFEDFERKVYLQENMLYLFPSMCKHSVNRQQQCDITRVGIAFNIKTEYCTK